MASQFGLCGGYDEQSSGNELQKIQQLRCEALQALHLHAVLRHAAPEQRARYNDVAPRPTQHVEQRHCAKRGNEPEQIDRRCKAHDALQFLLRAAPASDQ